MEKVLIIEDEPEARLLLARRLSASRFQTLGAGDGQTGLRQAKESCPDLIILDLQLPGEDGILIYHLLRQEESTQAIPVLFLTAISASGALTKESLALIASTKHGVELSGEYDVMAKPYDARRLIETLRGMLDGHP